MSESTGVPTNRREILVAGFKGLTAVHAIRDGQHAALPEGPGIYAVFRLNDAPPRFTAVSGAGRYKGQDPTLPVAALQAAWVPEAALLYVGKGANVRTRVRQLVEFGNGRAVAHAEGRALWQLSDMDDLLVAWRPAEDPKAAEAALRAAFADAYGKDPFANAL